MNDTKRMNKHKAVFLDRDGVINQDSGYVYKSSDISFIDGVFDACFALQQAGYLLVVVTNQSGVARGFYSEQDVMDLHVWMSEQFKSHGVNLNHFYFCPHHKDQGKGVYLKDCMFRKPSPGMLLKASEELQIELSKSIMIGDRESDILVGQNAGVGKTVRITSEHQLSKAMPDYTCSSLIDFTDRYLMNVQ
jgi:D-glycero-D-manno-heptose 1,7-bisphosphate phosphatase